jgi:ABC-type cobalt transport system substrate-binding protein
MNLVLIAGIILVVLVIAAALLKAKSGTSEGTAKPDVYYLKKSLFTPAERSFAGVLETLNFDGTAIAAKVRLADIFGVKKGLERSDRQRAQNRINAKHVDFLLVQKSDGRPLLGIELDDSSHEEEERVARDAFVDSVFSSAAIPLLHIAAKAAYDPREIRRKIDEAMVGKI